MDVASFYKDRSVIITGATGFIGQVLVEKLLRSCPGLRKVYVVARSKGNKTAAERTNDLLKLELFNRIRDECPLAVTKLVTLEGDIIFPDFGMSEKDVSMVIQEVSVFMHVAATVKFNEPLRVAAKSKLIGTINATQLAKKTRDLEAFVHVSTAFSTGDREIVDEIIYPSPLKPLDFLNMLQHKNDEELLEMTPHLLKGYPSTYQYTKHLAENYLIEHCKDLPLTITKPGVVSATWKEPFAGWSKSSQIPTILVTQVGKGQFHKLLVNSGPFELIPVDVVANHIIVAAWNVAINKIRSPPILNGVSSPMNKIMMKTYLSKLVSILRNYPLDQPSSYPACTSTDSKLMFKIYFFCNHYIPAALHDTYLMATGKEPRAVRLQKMLHFILEMSSKTLLPDKQYSCNNLLEVEARLNAKDKKEFVLGVKDLNWDSYLKNYVMGVQRHVFKEEESTLPARRQYLKRLYRRTVATKICLGVFSLSCIFYLISRR